MPTIFRYRGFEVKIRSRDHNPPHVHVTYGHEEVVILLGEGVDEPRIREIRGMRRANIRQAIDIVTANNGDFLVEWRRFHK